MLCVPGNAPTGKDSRIVLLALLFQRRLIPTPVGNRMEPVQYTSTLHQNPLLEKGNFTIAIYQSICELHTDARQIPDLLWRVV